MTERLEQPHDRAPRARGLEALQQEAERSRAPAKTRAGLQYRQDGRVFVYSQTDVLFLCMSPSTSVCG